ncbi:MAG: Glycosyltransferase [Candidatus Roizmanbacteria bacterium GW2011_GWC2_41_7]|uniref:Glycosyltransferase n=1 Tax=Candidatus Roizmanbacteria bacterium GW2011_GWC2_41_7 TaxID=1618487 RepID=A0A0G0XBF8_9BACT|nr:MAG: Glycosyltransferase [Candidatus Roizmanbacteria bacterium GW2011_GWC2_41_7]
MKNVLFIGVTKYNLAKDLHLKEKFEGLARGIKPYILARGELSHRRIFGADFYLLLRPIFWLIAPELAFWLCLTQKIDTIVVQGPLLEGLLGLVLKKTLHKELIVELHGDWEERLPTIRGILTFFAKRVLRNADKIRAVANYLVLKARKYAPAKPYFIFPTFTDLNDFLAEKEIIFNKEILFVGRTDRVKGIPYLIEAFELIKKDFPDFKLSLVGEGLPEGKLPLTEVRKRMKNCYCLVLPSITEGLPRVMLEAMALSKPVVASRVGGIPDLIKDSENGFLFEVGNVQELAEKLRILLDNKELAVEMGRRGRELVQSQFSNEKYINNYLAMINQ